LESIPAEIGTRTVTNCKGLGSSSLLPYHTLLPFAEIRKRGLVIKRKPTAIKDPNVYPPGLKVADEELLRSTSSETPFMVHGMILFTHKRWYLYFSVPPDVRYVVACLSRTETGFLPH
jgi:hypothetical protein